MARTMTMPMPQNTTHPAAVAPPIPEGQTAQALPDWLMQQQTILRTAPDGDTAIRLLYADLLAQCAMLQASNATLQARITDHDAMVEAAIRQARPIRQPSQRPAILALLEARGAPMTPAAITQALDAPKSLLDTLKGMADAGLLVRTDGHFALPQATAPPAAKGRGRIVRPG
jgi:hypothetical protein